MTIDKAIEILELRIKSPFTRANPDTKAAIQLGIEALKRLKWYRDVRKHWYIEPLPGETKP